MPLNCDVAFYLGFSMPRRSEFLFRERFNLVRENGDILLDGAAGPAPPVVPGAGTFAVAWRNYIRSVLKKGFMYRLSIKPSVILYVAENKTLAGKEERTYEGEALGRRLAIVFVEDIDGCLVRCVNRESPATKQEFISIAEILQTIDATALPPDPMRFCWRAATSTWRS